MTLKFLHAADIHLDSPLRGLSRYQGAPVEDLRSATRRAFTKLVDLAIEEQVAFLILAGDLYDGDWKDYNTGIFLMQQVARLGKHGIAVFAIAGNHDAANLMTKSLTLPANMILFSHKAPETHELADLSVALHGQSYAKQEVKDNLVTAYPGALPGRLNIGVLHTSLNGREGHAPYVPCSLDDLRSKGYDYWALGHVHTREVVHEKDPWVLFSGCLQGRHIRETGAKGATLVRVENRSIVSIEEKSVDVLRWYLCEVDLSSADTADQVLQCVRESISALQEHAEQRPLALRIRLHGPTVMASELAVSEQSWEFEIRNCTVEIATHLGLPIWIEKITNDTTPSVRTQRTHQEENDSQVSAAYDEALSQLLKAVHDPHYTLERIPELESDITKLQRKLPHSLQADPNTLQHLIDEGKRMIEGLLLKDGGTSLEN